MNIFEGNMQVDAVSDLTDEFVPDEEFKRQENLEFCKSVLQKLQLDNYDKFEITNLSVKFDLDISGESNFSKQKYILKKCVLEQILKVDSGDRYKTLLSETESLLKYQKYGGYSCCLVGCTFRGDRHRKYINHLKQVHISYDKFLCQFRHSCQRQFTSIDLLIQHIRVSHSDTQT